MKTRSTIQILCVLVLAVVAYSGAHAQDSIPLEKRRALHRFDPSDIFPEEREVGRSRARKKPKNEENAAIPRTRSLELVNPAPDATPRVPSRLAPPTPTPEVSEAVPTPTTTPEVAATPQPSTVAAVQSSTLPSEPGPGGGGGVASQLGSGQGFPVYFLLPLVFLILFVLIALIVSLKKQLRTP